MAFFALLASSALYFQPKKDLYLRLFPLFLLVVAVGMGVGGYLAAKAKPNLFIFNPLTILQVCFYFFVLYRIIHNKAVKRIALYLIILYPLVAGYNILFIQKHTFHSMTYSLGGLLVVTLCVYYFLELFQSRRSTNLMRQPDFWICSGLLFYFTCTFPIYGLLNFLKQPSRFIISNINIIFGVLDGLLFTSFAIAFLCGLKTRKSLS